MGESAGAGSVLHLLASPARGEPFDRAIAQSGQPITLDRGTAAEVAHTFAAALGVESASADELRTLPVEQLLDAQETTLGTMLGKVGPMAFAPSIDDEIVDGTVLEGVASGRASGVELVLGTTRDELALFPDPRAATLDDERLLRWIGALDPVVEPADVLARYRGHLGPEASSSAVWDAVRTDADDARAEPARCRRARGGRQPDVRLSLRLERARPRRRARRGRARSRSARSIVRGGARSSATTHERRSSGLRGVGRGPEFAAGGDPGATWHRYDERRTTTVFTEDGASLARDPAAGTRRCWMVD